MYVSNKFRHSEKRKRVPIALYEIRNEIGNYNVMYRYTVRTHTITDADSKRRIMHNNMYTLLRDQ